MGVKKVSDVIHGYGNDKVAEFLNGNHRRSITYRERLSIQESIDNIVNNSLKFSHGSISTEVSKVQKGETFLFGDIHGRLDMFVQNLYSAGLIDKDGNWSGGNKKAVLLGDLISRGPYSTETLVYAMALKKQAREQGGSVKVLMGNHEHLLINKHSVNFYNINHKDTFAEMLKKHIKNGEMQLAYADKTANVICVHAGIEKGILLKTISDINPDAKRALRKLPRNDEGKIDSRDIYKVMTNYHISVEDLANKMNDELRHNMSSHAPLLTAKGEKGRHFYKGNQSVGVINTRRKNSDADYAIDKDNYYNKPYKFTQIVGHTTTNYYDTKKRKINLEGATSFGAFKRINNKYYIDNDMIRGNRAFAVINEGKMYQVMMDEKGIDDKSDTRQNELIYESGIFNKAGKELSKTYNYLKGNAFGSYHGNTMGLDMSKWSVTKMVDLLNKENHTLIKTLSRNNKVEYKNFMLGNGLSLLRSEPKDEGVDLYQKRCLEDTLNMYSNTTKIPYSVIRDIQNLIKNSLENVDDVKDRLKTKSSSFDGADTVVFGDIHGEFKLFVQNLYLAGVIDENGNYNLENKKTVVQVGDITERGNNVLETYLYTRMLQKQAKDAGKEMHLLFGNHEKYEFRDRNNATSDKYKGKHIKSLLKNMIAEDVLNDRLKLTHADEQLNVIFSHGSISKKVILKTLIEMSKDRTYRDKFYSTDEGKQFFEDLRRSYLGDKYNQDNHSLKVEHLFSQKISSSEMYSALNNVGVSIKDVSDWMNNHLKKIMQKENGIIYKELKNDFLLAEDSGVFGRLKALDKKERRKEPEGFMVINENGLVDDKYKLKPVQIGGHTVTYSSHSKGATGEGLGIKQNRANIFVDAGLVKGRQAFLGINSKTGDVLTFELINKDNGLNLLEGYTKNKGLKLLNEKVDGVKISTMPGINLLRNYDTTAKSSENDVKESSSKTDGENPLNSEKSIRPIDKVVKFDDKEQVGEKDVVGHLEAIKRKESSISTELNKVLDGSATVRFTEYSKLELNKKREVNISSGKNVENGEIFNVKKGAIFLSGKASKLFRERLKEMKEVEFKTIRKIAEEIVSNKEFENQSFKVTNNESNNKQKEINDIFAQLKASEINSKIKLSAASSAKKATEMTSLNEAMSEYKQEKYLFLQEASKMFTVGKEGKIHSHKDLCKGALTFSKYRDELRKSYIDSGRLSNEEFKGKLQRWVETGKTTERMAKKIIQGRTV